MKKETYIKMTSLFRDGTRQRVLHITNKIFTYLMFLIYPVMLIYLFCVKSDLLVKSILVPLDSFIILSVFRYIVNRPRPYEKFQVASVIEKDTKGKSFPSRHVFSAFIISMTLIYCIPALPQMIPWMAVGVIMFVIAAGLGVIRVISGVHFISDVIAGAIFGIVAGYVGYFLLG